MTRRRRNWWWSLGLLCLLAVSTVLTRSTQGAACDDCIQIGTFNLYWLGSDQRYMQGLRTREDVERLARLIFRLDLEVVVLEEVNVELFSERNGEIRESRYQYAWLEAALQEDGYRLLPGSSGGGQRIVIAYDSDEVELLEEARELSVRGSFRLSGNCRSNGLRLPLAARFRAGNFDFWLVGVHLKSQLGAGSCPDRVREEQARDLLEAIDAELTADSDEEDVVIAGDFNATPSDRSLDPLFRDGGFLTLTWPGRRAEASSDISYLIGRFASLIDHLMIRPEATGEWVRTSTMVLDPDDLALGDYTRLYSDHAPVWASFTTNAADDD